ncbi:MAG TPA: PDZ domain-containing protein [Planctomycetes bacterium]|nr:PDZ domain-containing protein [Planctomycetota bacterium]
MGFAHRRGVIENGKPMPGAVVVRVAERDPAEKAGLGKGDVVLGVNGIPIIAPKELHDCIVCSDSAPASH